MMWGQGCNQLRTPAIGIKVIICWSRGEWVGSSSTLWRSTRIGLMCFETLGHQTAPVHVDSKAHTHLCVCVCTNS